MKTNHIACALTLVAMLTGCGSDDPPAENPKDNTANEGGAAGGEGEGEGEGEDEGEGEGEPMCAIDGMAWPPGIAAGACMAGGEGV